MHITAEQTKTGAVVSFHLDATDMDRLEQREDGSVAVWTTAAGADKRSLNGIQSILFHPDGRTEVTPHAEAVASTWKQRKAQ